jgi:hypothetical protein
MGNTLPQINSTRSRTTTKNGSSQYPALKKSRSLREYNRSTSLINSSTNSSTRKNISLQQRPTSIAPTDGEIIDIRALRCALPIPEIPPADVVSTSNVDNHGEKQLMTQLDYIHSCVRKDKGLFGKFYLIEIFIFYI